MTKSEYQELVEFLGVRFERIDERFDRMDQRFERIDERFDRMDQRFDSVESRLTRVEIRAEGNSHQIQTLAELIAALDQKLDRKVDEIRAEMNERFQETHLLIRTSYGDLDRRVTVLERPDESRS